MITALAARWVLTAVFAAASLTATLPWRAPAESAQLAERVSAVFCGAMASMSRAATPAPVLAVSILFAVSCAAASMSWLARAIGPGRRVTDPVSASRAAMSAGMAAMLFATL